MGPVSERTSRKDPRMSVGNTGDPSIAVVHSKRGAGFCVFTNTFHHPLTVIL